MVKRGVRAFVFVSVLLVAAGARAEEPRHGVTADVSLGLGATQTRTSYGVYNGSGFASFQSDSMEFAVLLPELSVDGWVSQKVAMGGRVSSFWYVPDDQQIVGGFFGLDLRFLPIPELMLGAAPGILLSGESLEGNAKAGFGCNLRGAYLPLVDPNFSFGFFGETTPGVVDGHFTYSAGAGLVLLVP